MRVLIVDDNKRFAETIMEVLSDFDHQVEICLDGERALAKVKEWTPEVILLDMHLPGGIEGAPLVQKFRQAAAGSKIFVVTGDPESESEARQAGADDVLIKPFEMAGLLKRLGSKA